MQSPGSPQPTSPVPLRQSVKQTFDKIFGAAQSSNSHSKPKLEETQKSNASLIHGELPSQQGDSVSPLDKNQKENTLAEYLTQKEIEKPIRKQQNASRIIQEEEEYPGYKYTKQIQIKGQSKHSRSLEHSSKTRPFDPSDSQIGQLTKPPQTALRRRAKILYDYYCKQQYTASSTFDQISHNSSVMTLNKFMMFCHTFGVSSKELNKYVLMERFKKYSEGAKQINIDQFVAILRSLEQTQQNFRQRIGIGSQKTFKDKLKKLNIPLPVPFAKQEASLTTSVRSKVTSRLHYQFKDSLNLGDFKKMQSITPDSQRQPSKSINSLIPRKDSIEGPKSLLKPPIDITNKLRGLSIADLIQEESQDQQWLKQYRIQRKSSTLQRPKLPLNSKQHKQHIVENIRHRINQVSKTQLVRQSNLKSKVEQISRNPKKKLFGSPNK